MNPDNMDRMVQLAALTESLEQRSAQAVQQAQQASNTLQHTAQEAARTSQRITTEALEQFRRTAASAATEGLRSPLQDAEKTLKNSIARMETAAETLEERMKAQRKMFAAYAWKTFIASAGAALAVIGVAVYMYESLRSRWSVSLRPTAWARVSVSGGGVTKAPVLSSVPAVSAVRRLTISWISAAA
jgi:hypothetical protein